MRANADSRKGHTVWGCSARTYTVVCIHWQKLYHSSLSRQWYDCQDKRDGLCNLHKLGKFKIVKCLLIYKLCNLLNIQFGGNWKIGKQLFGGGGWGRLFSLPWTCIHISWILHREYKFATQGTGGVHFLCFWIFGIAWGFGILWGGVSARSQGNSLGGVNSLGGGCFRIRKSTLWGGDTINKMRLPY